MGDLGERQLWAESGGSLQERIQIISIAKADLIAGQSMLPFQRMVLPLVVSSQWN